MNGELPPIDPDIREHLARRSAGRLADGLIADVSAAVDAVAVERPRRLRPLGQAGWRAPQLAVAACLALVVVVAAGLFAVPHFVTSPAGNTSYAALTTSELASLLASRSQPATNTTLVASVTVDSRDDVCPMNHYPTLGVIEGMGSQVCVMGADLNAYLSSDRVNAAKVSGTFAFRYLGPGVLGLIGQLTLPSAGVTYRATDEWPLQGRTFLIDGWLAADELTASCAMTPVAGDVLQPDGNDCPFDDWLGTDATAPGIAADHEYGAAAPNPSYDPLALRGNARHVEAGGMRIIDSIDHAAPVHGVFVVRSVTAGCPNSSSSNSRGCGVWRVLARVSDTSLHAPAVTPAATASPIGAYPADRALTTAELARLLSGPQLPVNTALVASVTIDPQPEACPMNSRPTYGVIHGIEPQVCVVGAIGDTQGSVAAGANTFAFRYLGPGVLELLGLVQPASASRQAHAAADDWTQAGKVFMVEGWLGHGVVQPAADHSCDPVAADNCAAPGWLSDVQSPATDQVKYIVDEEMKAVDSILSQPARFGVYVVTPNSPNCPSPAQSAPTYCRWRVLARVTNVLQAVPSSPPTAVPTSTPTIAPPATPLIPLAGATFGLFGWGNRPLTETELAAQWAADPAHLAGRIAIVKGPVPTGLHCSDIVVPASPGCGVPEPGATIAPEGYWVVGIGANGQLSIVGQISIPDPGFVYSLDQVNASTTLKSGDLLMVSGWLLEHVVTCDFGATPLPAGCGPFPEIDSTGSDNSPAGIGVQLGAYAQFTGNAGDWKVEGPPVEGVFLVRFTNGNIGTIVARMEVAIP